MKLLYSLAGISLVCSMTSLTLAGWMFCESRSDRGKSLLWMLNVGDRVTVLSGPPYELHVNDAGDVEVFSILDGGVLVLRDASDGYASRRIAVEHIAAVYAGELPGRLQPSGEFTLAGR